MKYINGMLVRTVTAAAPALPFPSCYHPSLLYLWLRSQMDKKKIKEKICFWAQRRDIKGNTQKTTCLVTSPERVCQVCDRQVWSAPITAQITSNHKPYITTNHKHWFSQTAGALWSRECQECNPLHVICVKVVTEWAGPPRVLGCLERSLPKPGYFLWGAGDWSKASGSTTNGQQLRQQYSWHLKGSFFAVSMKRSNQLGRCDDRRGWFVNSFVFTVARHFCVLWGRSYGSVVECLAHLCPALGCSTNKPEICELYGL